MKLIVFILLISLSAIAKKQVQISVELSPAGSFQAVNKKIKGKVKKKDGKFYAKELKVPIKFFKTDIELRDKHLKEYLGFPKHKYVTLKKAVGKGGQGKGELTIKGITKPLTFKYKQNKKKKKYLDVEFTLSLKKFGLPKKQYMGIGVEDKVVVKATVPVKK